MSAWGYEFVLSDGVTLVERDEATLRIDTLRAQLEAAEAENRTRSEDYARLTDLWKADEAKYVARAEAAEADAARFAWWFERGLESSDELLELHLRAIHGDFPTTDDWRSAIDAARTKEQQA